MASQLQKLIERVKKEYPGRGFSIKKVDENLYAVTLKATANKPTEVVYMRGEK